MKKKILIILLIVIITIFFYFDLNQYLTLSFVRDNFNLISKIYQNNQVAFTLGYFLIYVAITSISLPGAAILTLVGGSLFGFTIGLVLVSFASSIGALFAFLGARYLFRESLTRKFSNQFKVIDQNIEINGAWYLASLRLIPIFPFFLINILLGLTKINAMKFYIVSQISMLLGTAVYVNAGTQLKTITTLSDVVSFNVLVSFILLGFFPLIMKLIVKYLESKKVYKAYIKPKKFDYNMIAIGAGAGGLVTSYISAAVGAKVALIEKHKMGGDCLNTGCVPSKALIKCASVANKISESKKYGMDVEEFSVDFKKVLKIVKNSIDKIEPHDSVERYEKLGVKCLTGEAIIVSPWEVKINGEILTTKNITISTGARPFVPQIKGLRDDYYTSDTIWDLEELPSKLVIIGAGPIGCELGQAFSRLGSKVTIVDIGSQLLSSEDSEVSDLVLKKLLNEEISIRFNTSLEEVDEGGKKITLSKDNEKVELEYSHLFFATGRAANISGFGLEGLNLEYNENKTIKVNSYMQTKYPNIFACGDVAGPYQLTHMASHQAWYCAVNGLFGLFKKFSVDYSVVSWAIYTDPQVATVGLTEKKAKEDKIDYDLFTYDLSDLDRAIVDQVDYGVVRVLTRKDSDKIIGATIVGENSAEVIIEFIAAIKYKKGLNDILSTIHPYPTMIEGNKYVAGIWKKNTVSKRLMKIVTKYHTLLRG